MRETVLIKDDVMQILKRYGLILDKCTYETMFSEIDKLITFTMSIRTYTEHYCKDCKKCDSCGKTSDDLITCDWFESKPEIKTVADKIRNMNDSELRLFLETIVDGCINYENDGCKDCAVPHENGTCYFQQFLKTPIEKSKFDFSTIEEIGKDYEEYYKEHEIETVKESDKHTIPAITVVTKSDNIKIYTDITYDINSGILTITDEKGIVAIYNFDDVSHIYFTRSVESIYNS